MEKQVYEAPKIEVISIEPIEDLMYYGVSLGLEEGDLYF